MPRGRPEKGRTEAFIVRSGELIGWALGGVEREIAETRERLSTLMTQAAKLRGRLATLQRRTAQGSSTGTRRRSRRRMSAAARKRISEMMKKRWAERKRRQK